MKPADEIVAQIMVENRGPKSTTTEVAMLVRGCARTSFWRGCTQGPGFVGALTASLQVGQGALFFLSLHFSLTLISFIRLGFGGMLSILLAALVCFACGAAASPALAADQVEW